MIHFLHYQVHLIYCLSNWSSAKSLFKKKKNVSLSRLVNVHLAMEFILWFEFYEKSRQVQGLAEVREAP